MIISFQLNYYYNVKNFLKKLQISVKKSYQQASLKKTRLKVSLHLHFYGC